MGRPTGLIGVLTVSLFWGCGCSAPGRHSLAELFRKPSREISADETRPSDKTNPLLRKNEHRKSSVAQTPSPQDVTPSGSQPSASRQSLIRSIVDAEMKESSPSERDAMYQNVQNLDPAFARQVLSMNRLVRQMGQQSPGQQRLRTASADAEDAEAPRNHPTIRTAFHEEAADSQQIAAASPIALVSGVEDSLQPTAAIGATPWLAGDSSGRASKFSSYRFPLGGQRGRNGTAADRITKPIFGNRFAYATGDVRRTDEKPPLPDGIASPVGRPEFGRLTAPPNADAEQIGPTSALGDSTSDLQLAEWHEGLSRLIARAETAAAQNRPDNKTSPESEHDYIEKQVYLRMLYLMNDQRARSIEPIYGIDAADQEFWQQMFWGIAGYFDRRTIPDPRKRVTETLASLQKAVRDLQPKAALKLANVAFCHKITSYGNYETFDRNKFRPGRPVLLYAEVENFASERTADNRFRTILKSTIELMDSAGNVLQKIPFSATEDLCRNYRRDYFHSYEFSIPETRTIGFGPHKVRLTVQDEIGGQLATYTLNFNVTGN